jgi:uncharacterized protein (TIGR02099 family)
MKRLLRAIEVLAWGAFFVFAALVLALRFWVLPDIERYREDIVAAMSRSIGLPVRVGAIEAGWLGLRPQITLSDVRISDAQGREALVLPSIDNVIAWRSLLARELRLHRLVIGDGLRLGVRRDAAGDLYVAGLKIARGEGGAGFGGWLLGQGEIVIRNAEIEWRDEQRGAPPLVFSSLELKLVNSGASHSVGLTARTPPELGGRIELRALVEGSALQAAALSGRVFLQLGYTDLAAWRAWVDYPLDVRHGQGALRVWATLEKGELKQGTADVALADVWASLGDELVPLELASMQGRVQGRALADGVELSGRGLALVVQRGPEVPKTDFQIVWRPQAGGSLAASLVDLQAIAHLVGSLPLPPQIAVHLAELAPHGRLADSRLEWSGPFDAPARLAARARFSDLAMRARGGLPGFSGLSGSLETTQDKGRVSVSSKKTEIELPRVFPEPRIALDALAGELDWERDRAGGLTLRVSSLSFANEHASGNLFGSYVDRGEGPGTIDLSAVLNRADAGSVARYLPHPSIMGETARNWIAGAIVAGEASDVRVRVRGDLREFPFADPARGQFQVTARVEKGVLDYAGGWPRIHDIVGELAFEGERVEIVARSGTVLGARLANVRVSIPKLGPNSHVLVSGHADGPTAEFLKYVASSPLRETAAGFSAGMKAAGRGKLRLKLDLPLANLDRTKLAGEYDFAANQVTLYSWLPPIEQAAGKLAFTESSFTVHDVRGRLLGGALTVAGGTQPGRGVEIVARGEAAFEATRALFDHPLRKQVTGSFSYLVKVNAQDGLARVSFDSPLRGIESRLPAPLAKSAAEALPLRIEVTPAAGGERDRISVALGGLARAEAARRRQGEAMVVQRTAVWLTPERDQPIRLPERPGTLVYGSLAAFDLDRWLPLFGNSDEGSPPVALELKFGSLDAFGRRLTNVVLRASAEAAGWSANVNADELAGDVSYRAAQGGRLIARLARFTVPADTPGAKPQAAGRPSELPALDLVADEFTFRGKQLGRVELVANRDGQDWRIESASMVSPDASLTGRGVWRAAPSRTAVEFDLHAGDAGSFLARVGHPDLVKGGKARLRGSLAWQGDPATLDFPTLAGELQLQAEDGQFLEIEPGLGKLVSLMSLQALPRRIALDFRDVFSKGFQFDRIASAAQVERGVIKLKEFRMRGSAADVEMSGEADIARETQNLRVRVVPSLGDSAALGLTLVNPVAGVAAAIAQRILKNPLGQIFAYDYSVTGGWSDPKVVKIQPPPQPQETPAQ